jgi:hypothetical protein
LNEDPSKCSGGPFISGEEAIDYLDDVEENYDVKEQEPNK